MKWIRHIIWMIGWIIKHPISVFRYYTSKRYRNDCRVMRSFLMDIAEIERRRLPIVEACQIVSENPPSEWPEEVLYPYYHEGIYHEPPYAKRIYGASIFGHQHVAMDRTRTISLIDALMWTGLCESKGEIRKVIKNNGIMVNRKKMTDYNYILSANDACPKVDAIVLEYGKYNFGIIELC